MPLDPVSTGDPHVPAHNAEREAVNSLEESLATKITLPNGAATGDLLRFDGANWVTTETRFFEGDGTPNGVVAAPVGSRYVDKQATRGGVEWVKTSGGETNTGWTTSIGALAPIGQTGTITISGPSARTKSRLVPLDSGIFLGAAPRQVLLTGVFNDYVHFWVISKVANGFNVGVRHIDNVTLTAASIFTVDFFAII